MHCPEDQPRRENSIWQRLNRVVVGLIALAVIAGVICIFLPEQERQRDLLAETERLQLQIDTERSLLDRQTRQLEWLKNDPAYLEMIARDRMDLMRPGETIFRVELPKPAASNVPPR